jgi:hypothetical protein
MSDAPNNHFDEDYHCILDANDKMDYYFFVLKSKQNLLLGILTSLFVIFIVALIWCQITAKTGMNADGMIVFIGLGVGLSMHYVGKGIEYSFGWYGLAITFVGIIIASYFNAFAGMNIDSVTSGNHWLDMLFDFTPSFIFNSIWQKFSLLDLVFYITACLLGFRLSFRVVGHSEVIKQIGVDVNDKNQYHKKDDN